MALFAATNSNVVTGTQPEKIKVLFITGYARCGSILLDRMLGQIDDGVDHTAGGNPSRFETGSVDIRPDDDWRYQMPGRRRPYVTALTWPLLVRYGYARS